MSASSWSAKAASSAANAALFQAAQRPSGSASLLSACALVSCCPARTPATPTPLTASRSRRTTPVSSFVQASGGSAPVLFRVAVRLWLAPPLARFVLLDEIVPSARRVAELPPTYPMHRRADPRQMSCRSRLLCLPGTLRSSAEMSPSIRAHRRAPHPVRRHEARQPSRRRGQRERRNISASDTSDPSSDVCSSVAGECTGDDGAPHGERGRQPSRPRAHRR